MVGSVAILGNAPSLVDGAAHTILVEAGRCTLIAVRLLRDCYVIAT